MYFREFRGLKDWEATGVERGAQGEGGEALGLPDRLKAELRTGRWGLGWLGAGADKGVGGTGREARGGF